jgi:glycine/D-amino acid oxidase-like deaminating enzyme
MHLLALVVGKGVNLQTNTPVLSVSDSTDSGGRWIIKTPRGSIAAQRVVLASNGYIAGIAPQYTGKIVPCRGICSRITTPEGKPAPYLSNTYVIRRGKGIYDYLIRRPDGSIVVGGARQTFIADQEQWYGVVDDTTLIEPAKDYFEGYMQRNFSGWEESGAYTDKVWTGGKCSFSGLFDIVMVD